MAVNAKNFTGMSGEMVHCTPSKTKQEIDARANTGEVRKLAKELHQKIQGAKGLHNVKAPRRPSPYWSLLTTTSWRLINPKLDQVRTITAIALEESEKAVLLARGKSLFSKDIMDLRFGIWMAVNLWLCWNTTALPGARKEFSYWDQCADQVADAQRLYCGEVAETISEIMVQDMQFLKQLGDTLVISPALTNNGRAHPNKRVISIEAKGIIDAALKVSKATEHPLFTS